MEWLFRSDFEAATIVALWSIAAVLVTTVILFVYTMGLRLTTVAATRRRDRFLSTWREIFASAILSPTTAENSKLPPLHRHHRVDLLEEWNRACSIVTGSASANLITLAGRANIPELARALFKKRRINSKILAVQTFGHLRDTSHKDAIRELVSNENTALSITAAMSLVQIDPDFGISVVVPMIAERRDWPKNRVSIILRIAGSGRISEPMYRAIRSANGASRTYLLQFARLIDAEILDALLDDLIRSSNDPGVINAALKLVSGYRGVPRIAALTQHDTWFIRMQAAKVLGRTGQQEHLTLLESLLDDREWWVRYRAAQSIASLPFLGPNQMRQIRQRQKDRYAVDILQQAFAEVGLA
ncbi:MAG: HEAT repeat domain-containing protein [Gammaproteobacteria bacterium]|nr:HEAT repeat domain-containing protein [Gammaproteobacteria bacterium]